MDFFGLDLGTSSAKLIQLRKSGSNFYLVSAGMTPFPSGALFSEAKPDKEKIANSLKKLLIDTKVSTKNVAASLPTSNVFERLIELPPLSESEVASAISWEAEQYVPFPVKDATLAWHVVSRPSPGAEGKQMEVLLIAAPKTLIERQTELLKLAGLSPVALETEMVSMTRVFGQEGGPVAIIVSFGARSTDLGIIRGKNLLLSASVSSGSETLTKILASEFGLDDRQAEEYKKTYGVLQKQLQGKVRRVILPLMEILIKEMRKAIAFWSQKHPEEKVGRAILCGGGSSMPGLVEFLTESLGIEVEVGDPLAKIAKSSPALTQLSQKGSSFAVAVGLAMKEI